MTKDDKQFFKGLINGLEKKITGVESRLEQEIHHLGVKFEKLEDDFKVFGENQCVMDNRLKKVESDVGEIKEKTSDYPVLRGVVKEHSRLLTKLCR